MSSKDDQFDDDPDLVAVVDEMDRHSHELYNLVTDYMDEHDVSEAMASHLLLGLALNLRMLAYGLETGQPSASGLRLDLDRFRREVEDVIRDTKKGAEAFIDEVRSALADDDGDDDDDETDEGKEP